MRSTLKGWGPIAATTTLLLAVVVAVPLVFILLQAIFPFFGRGSLAEPLSRFSVVLGDPDLWHLIANTLALGLCVTLGSALIGVPLGYLRAASRLPFGRLWDLMFLIPFMIPPYIATLGWVVTLQPNGFLRQLAGVDFGRFLFSFSGIVFVMVLHVFPVVYFAVSRVIAAIGGRLSDVSRVFGASPVIAFWRVTLPLATPGIAASLLLVFAMSIEEYGTPAALGARSGFEVLVTSIETRISDWPIDLSGASILSLLLIGISLIAFAVQERIIGRRSYITKGGNPQPPQPFSLGVATTPVVAIFGIVTVLATVVPICAVLATASLETMSGGLAIGNLGLRQFRLLLENQSGSLIALRNSLLLGIAAALVTGLIGTLTAYCVVRLSFRGRRMLDALTMLPNAIPGIVVAVGLILAWNQPALPVSPYNTPLILLIAYCCILLPYPVRYANAALRQIGENLEDAARVAGATPFLVFRRIILPLVAPSVISAMLLVFAVASRELVASILLAPVGMQTIATFIWRQFEQGSVGLGMAMSCVALFITTSVPLAVHLMSGARGQHVD